MDGANSGFMFSRFWKNEWESTEYKLQQFYFPNDAAETRLKVALSTNSPLGTPPTPSIEMSMLIGPDFGKLIV